MYRLFLSLIIVAVFFSGYAQTAHLIQINNWEGEFEISKFHDKHISVSGFSVGEQFVSYLNPVKKKLVFASNDGDYSMDVPKGTACHDIEGFTDKCNELNGGWVSYLPRCTNQSNKAECWKRFEEHKNNQN